MNLLPNGSRCTCINCIDGNQILNNKDNNTEVHVKLYMDSTLSILVSGKIYAKITFVLLFLCLHITRLLVFLRIM